MSYTEFRSRQKAFGKRKLLVNPQNAVVGPRWAGVKAKIRRDARSRKKMDNLKKIWFATHPRDSIFSLYGNFINREGKDEKYSFDMVLPADWSQEQKYRRIAAIMERLYGGLIPEDYYYTFYPLGPDEVIRGRWKPQLGLTKYMGKKIEYQRKKTRIEQWEPKARIKRRRVAKPWRAIDWHLYAAKEKIPLTEEQMQIIWYRHELRKLGKEFYEYYVDPTIRRAEIAWLKAIGWKGPFPKERVPEKKRWKRRQ